MSADRDPCERAPADVEDLVDGLLDERTSHRLLHHLESCETCREVFDEEERLRAAPARAPEGFADEVMARVRKRPSPGSSRRVLRLLVPSLTAAILLVMALFDEEPPGGPTEDVDRSPVARGESPEEAPEFGIVGTVEPDTGESRTEDLVRRARLLLAAADRSPETVLHEIGLAGIAEAAEGIDRDDLPAADRDAVRRILLLGEALRNGSPGTRAELAFLTETRR